MAWGQDDVKHHRPNLTVCHHLIPIKPPRFFAIVSRACEASNPDRLTATIRIEEICKHSDGKSVAKQLTSSTQALDQRMWKY